ncbi:distal tail protein Dit, partial [Bacillus toyonensis]
MLIGRKRPSWSPIKRNLVRVPHRPGAFFINTETEERRIDVPLVIKAKKDIADLQKLKEDLANWLITEQPAELIFDDELDRTYLAFIDGSIDLDEMVNRGKGVITFICPMPYKLGPIRNAKAKLESNNIIKMDALNEGSVFSEPKFKIQVENPSTFIDIINKNGDQHFRIGYPVKVDETPISRYELVMHDKANSLVGWTEVGKDFVSDYGSV